MKKSIAIITTLIASLAAAPYAIAQAPVKSTVFRFECPNASGGVTSERLTNYGTYISGMGEENINGKKKALPVFRGVSNPGIPLHLALAAYKHNGTLYNEHSGRVTCLYKSTNGKGSPFNVSYTTLNIKKGFVTKSDPSSITIKVFQG